MRAVLALLALALVVRLIAVGAIAFTPVSDPADYVRHASVIAATGSYPYQINLLGIVVKSGNMTSTITERVE